LVCPCDNSDRIKKKKSNDKGDFLLKQCLDIFKNLMVEKIGRAGKIAGAMLFTPQKKFVELVLLRSKNNSGICIIN